MPVDERNNKFYSLRLGMSSRQERQVHVSVVNVTLLQYFNALKPDRKVKLTVRRTAGEKTLAVTAAQMPTHVRERWKLSQQRAESESAN